MSDTGYISSLVATVDQVAGAATVSVRGGVRSFSAGKVRLPESSTRLLT